MSRLNITNGDRVADLLKESEVLGEALPWRDLLHEGPVPAGLSLEELSRVRARFIAGSLDGRSFDQVLADFVRRDRSLQSFKRHDEVVLWFEHDLYDQLQLLQLLHWFAQREPGRTRLGLVCIDGHPEIDRFLGLGQLAPAQLEGLDERRQELQPEQLTLATCAWDGFCAGQPDALCRLAGEDSPALPFLQAALNRHLEQFPWTSDGLSRSERQILQTVDAGVAELGAVFRESQIEREESPFLSDQAFLFQLSSICGGRSNLVQFEDGEGFGAAGGPPWAEEIWKRRLQLTEIGRRILSGQADNVRLYGIDRWLGGVHLEGSQASWRWDGRRRIMVAFSA